MYKDIMTKKGVKSTIPNNEKVMSINLFNIYFEPY